MARHGPILDLGRPVGRSLIMTIGVAIRGWRCWVLRRGRRSARPVLESKIRDVVGLYLDPPDNAVVVCVDEKSQIQVATGRITADACYPRHRNGEFLAFLKQVAKAHPRVKLQVVCDNYAGRGLLRDHHPLGHPRVHRRLQRALPALRLDQDRRPDPRPCPTTYPERGTGSVNSPYPTWQGRSIIDSPVPGLMTTQGAIVLERIARGGGATNWYHCADHANLAALTAELRPGSVVSFYFDDRITHCRYTPNVREQMLQLIHVLHDMPGETGEIVVGHLAADELHIAVDYPGTAEELDKFTQTLGTHSWIYYGRFPGCDNDGTNAVTLTLPDLDGTIRDHPH